ncbi:MAG TPA: Rrf2 family transcriptional regulator [Gemmataceae bacterium]|nr:Rrf2 family transcriptional regulator [Gemmataceae bacterium]
MRISAKAEYACVAMLELAANYADGQPVRIKAIADAQGIPGRFLVQILLQLKTAGLAASVRGASGGYQLARPPESISLAAVINAIDDRTLTPRSALAEANRSPAVQTLLAVWREIQTEEQRLLEQLTLAELLRRAQQSNALSYQI